MASNSVYAHSHSVCRRAMRVFPTTDSSVWLNRALVYSLESNISQFGFAAQQQTEKPDERNEQQPNLNKYM